MHTLKTAVGGMTALRQWFSWRLAWNAQAQKFDKAPCTIDGARFPINAGDESSWHDFDTVAAAVANLDTSGAAVRHAMGFWLTASDPYFLLDMDAALAGDGQQWLPLAVQLCESLPGAMVERSSSGKGLHVIGRGNPPPHRTRPTQPVPFGLEFYTQGRGIAFGLDGHAQGSADTLCNLAPLVEAYFRPLPGPQLAAQDGGFAGDDAALVQRALAARVSPAAAFSGKASFAQLWAGECERNSENDMALASHLAFWAGRDVERMLRLMWRSGMVREKWRDHRTYLSMTCENAAAGCSNVYQPMPPQLSPRAHSPLVQSATDLRRREFKPVQWAIKDILPQGVTIVFGSPKIGKSWLVYQFCIAVAAGYPLWHGREREQQGDALYLDLEGNERRLRDRLDVQLIGFPGADVSRLYYATEWPRAEAGIAQLRAFLTSHPECRIVAIDTVSAFREAAPKSSSAYAADYAVGEMFKGLAREFDVAIVLVMHDRKDQTSGDWMQGVSGTQGMTGGVDNVLGLQRTRGDLDAALHVDGRDIKEPKELALRLLGGRWSLVGELADVQRSKDRTAVLAALTQSGGAMTAQECHAAIPEKSYGAIRVLLHRMVKAGELGLDGKIYTSNLSSSSLAGPTAPA